MYHLTIARIRLHHQLVARRLLTYSINQNYELEGSVSTTSKPHEQLNNEHDIAHHPIHGISK